MENLFAAAKATIRTNGESTNSAQQISDMPRDIFVSTKSLKWPFRFGLRDIVWRNVIVLAYANIATLYGAYLYLRLEVSPLLLVVVYAVATFTGMGVTAGTHRLWCHRAYKAKWQLRLILMIAQTMALQQSIYVWVRDHRVHHKYTDTNADPHNASRGFFYSHMGWIMLRKHPDVSLKGKTIDLSDLEQDPIVMFQNRHYAWLMPLFAIILPTIAFQYFAGLSLFLAWHCTTLPRWVFSVHVTWLVNSAAHIYGAKPYDRTMQASQNKVVSLFALGEGWHNYHHVFPWDYKTAELGNYSLNWTNAFIDFFARIGWAYELKVVSEEVIRKRAERTGDGSNEYSNCIKLKLKNLQNNNNNNHDDGHDDEKQVWGWDDKDMNCDDKKYAIIINKEQ